MKLNDEILSAFLDGELPENEREEVRLAISTNPALAERLSKLATTDDLVRKHAASIDVVPLPAAIQRLLQTDNVVHLSAWQRARHLVREHTALAASLVLATGLATGYLAIQTSGANPDSEQIARVLDSAPSGQMVSVSEDTSLLSRFTFRDVEGRYCRQYHLASRDAVSENVACRGDGEWQQVVAVEVPGTYNPEEYRTASNPALLDSTLDAMMQGNALSLAEEEALIRGGW